MQDEDAEIDFTEPDDLEENTGLEYRRAGTLCGKSLMWCVGIGCALYGAAKLSNWLIGIPASLKETDRTIFSFVLMFIGIALLSAVTSCIDSTVREFRVRYRQMNHRLTRIEAQIESTKRSEPSKFMEG